MIIAPFPLGEAHSLEKAFAEQAQEKAEPEPPQAPPGASVETAASEDTEKGKNMGKMRFLAILICVFINFHIL